MNDTQETPEILETASEQMIYRRRSSSKPETHNVEDLAISTLATETSRSVGQPKRFRPTTTSLLWIALLSLLVTATTVVLPFLSGLMTNQQELNLYTGQMMANGQLPYTSIFATGGFLFYVLIWVSQALGSSLWLLAIQFLTLYASGKLFYKILYYFTSDIKATHTGLFIFYLSQLALGFGGLYPVQWAMPIILWGIWFFIRYVNGHMSDEAFILYGLLSALSLVIEPKTLGFWIIIFLFLSGYNIANKRIARGFYQNLAIFFGFSLVFYTVGYFIFNMELLVPALSQTFGYPISALLSSPLSWLAILCQVALAYFSGLIFGLVTFAEQLRKSTEDHLIKWLLFITSLLYLIFAFFTGGFTSDALLLALPFGLLLTLISLDYFIKLRKARRHSHRRDADKRELFGSFMATHLFGPVVLLFITVGLSIYNNLTSQDVSTERQTIVTYLKKETKSSDPILVLDNQATIYLDSLRPSATQYPVPSLFQTSQTQQDFEDEVVGNDAKVVIVNKNYALSKNISDKLADSYDKQSVDNLDYFTVYVLKD